MEEGTAKYAKDAKSLFLKSVRGDGSNSRRLQRYFQFAKAPASRSAPQAARHLAVAVLRRAGKKLGEGCGLRGRGTRCKRKGVKSTEAQPNSHSPLESMEEWDDFLKERYPEPGISPEGKFQATDPTKTKEQFRNYEANARPSVREFYRQNHLHQTYEFAQAKRKEYLGLNHRKMGVCRAVARKWN